MSKYRHTQQKAKEQIFWIPFVVQNFCHKFYMSNVKPNLLYLKCKMQIVSYLGKEFGTVIKHT